MAKRRLTDRFILAVKPPKTGQATYHDIGFPGHELVVSYGGTRSFYDRFRFRDEQRHPCHGQYPGLSLAASRDRWRETRTQLSRGVDPATTIMSGSTETVATVMAEWLARDQATNRSVAAVKQNMEKDVIPFVGQYPISTLGRKDVCRPVAGAVTFLGAILSEHHEGDDMTPSEITAKFIALLRKAMPGVIETMRETMQ
jgi:Arm DNA-binding domain